MRFIKRKKAIDQLLQSRRRQFRNNRIESRPLLIGRRSTIVLHTSIERKFYIGENIIHTRVAIFSRAFVMNKRDFMVSDQQLSGFYHSLIPPFSLSSVSSLSETLRWLSCSRNANKSISITPLRFSHVSTNSILLTEFLQILESLPKWSFYSFLCIRKYEPIQRFQKPSIERNAVADGTIFENCIKLRMC